VSIVPAAAPRPETQEEILAAALAARNERDIPAEDDSWIIEDSDGDRPAELAGLDGEQLDELIAAASPGPSGQGRLPGPGWLTELGEQVAVPAGPTWLTERDEFSAPAPAGRPEVGPADFLPGSGLGGAAGFAEGGVLDGLPPGLPLAGFAEDAHARLAGLSDDELIGVLRAWRRQTSWAQARELAAITELARRRPADGTPPGRPGQLPGNVSEFTADEVALALTLTRRSAGAQLDMALALADRPATAAALEAGTIDLLKVRVIIDGVAGLAPEHATAVEATVLPEAPGMTSGQLRAAVADAVLAADPDAARKQREEDLKDARVECSTDPAGTANLAGRNLPCAETLAADKRLGQVARAWKKQISAAWKQADPGEVQPRPAVGTDLLRARAYLALLLGQWVDSPPADLLPPAVAAGSGACTGNGRPGPSSSTGDRVIQGDQHVPPGLRRDCQSAAASADGPDRGLPPLAGQVFLTLPLATLLGLSDAPGGAAGYGPVDPDTSRALARAAAGHPAAGWHLIITDPHGRAVGYAHAPRAGPARGHPADGWTITLTTERIARGQSP
jgi:hypothetical protein